MHLDHKGASYVAKLLNQNKNKQADKSKTAIIVMAVLRSNAWGNT